MESKVGREKGKEEQDLNTGEKDDVESAKAGGRIEKWTRQATLDGGQEASVNSQPFTPSAVLQKPVLGSTMSSSTPAHIEVDEERVR